MVTFFANDPEPGDEVEVEQQPTPDPPWQGAPNAEIPVVLPISALLTSTDQAALVLSGVRVFSNGLEFSVEVKVRRADLPDDDWDDLLERVQGFGHRRARRRPSRLRVGTQLADGSKLVSGDGGWSSEGSDPGPQLVSSGGNGSGSDRFWVSSRSFWLWPLPPEGPVRIVADWPQLGLAEGSALVDLTDLQSIVGRVRSIWSDSGPMNSGARSTWSVGFTASDEEPSAR